MNRLIVFLSILFAVQAASEPVCAQKFEAPDNTPSKFRSTVRTLGAQWKIALRLITNSMSQLQDNTGCPGRAKLNLVIRKLDVELAEITHDLDNYSGAELTALTQLVRQYTEDRAVILQTMETVDQMFAIKASLSESIEVLHSSTESFEAQENYANVAVEAAKTLKSAYEERTGNGGPKTGKDVGEELFEIFGGMELSKRILTRVLRSLKADLIEMQRSTNEPSPFKNKLGRVEKPKVRAVEKWVEIMDRHVETYESIFEKFESEVVGESRKIAKNVFNIREEIDQNLPFVKAAIQYNLEIAKDKARKIIERDERVKEFAATLKTLASETATKLRVFVVTEGMLKEELEAGDDHDASRLLAEKEEISDELELLNEAKEYSRRIDPKDDPAERVNGAIEKMKSAIQNSRD